MGSLSLRYALLVVGVANVLAGFFYLRAARTLRADLASRED